MPETVSMPVWKTVEAYDSAALILIHQRSVPVEEIKAAEREIGPELARELHRLCEGGVTRLDVVIDCMGGSTVAAMGIRIALDKWEGAMRCLIDGDCFSSATIIAFGPPWPVAITPGSMVIIHQPQMTRWHRSGAGPWTKETRPSASQTLDHMRVIYSLRTGRPETETEEWITQGKTFTAPQACACGLCDEMMPRREWEKG